MLPQYRHIWNLKQHREAMQLLYRLPLGHGKMNGYDSDHLGEFKTSG